MNFTCNHVEPLIPQTNTSEKMKILIQEHKSTVMSFKARVLQRAEVFLSLQCKKCFASEFK